MKYPEMDWGKMEAIVNRLGGMKGVRRFLSGQTVLSWSQRTFRTLQPIEFGNGLKTVDDFRQMYKRWNCVIDGISGQDCLSVFDDLPLELHPRKEFVEFVVVSLSELGFTDGPATRQEICECAQGFGLGLCSLEDVLQLRLQVFHKVKPATLWIGTEFDIKLKDGSPIVFYLGQPEGDETRWLKLVKDKLEHSFDDSEWIFRRAPRIKKPQAQVS